MNYCAGWVRQQENQQLGIPREIARGFAPRLRELVGYGVYRGLIGHIDKRNPNELLGESGALETVWETANRVRAPRG
jgi:ectoine hydroxylase-related dioxygenase (phytanoyl-CoA dioxygenase family)